jgi:hypothetical protein
MPTPEQHTLDAYAPLAHKVGLIDRNHALAPTWVPATAQRRLAAYKILAGYLSNVARWFLDTTTPGTADNRREYGDPALLVSRIVSALLGDDPSIVVDGARADATPPLPPRPPGPDDLPADATDLERRVAEVAVDRWERDATAVVDEWVAAVEAQPARAERQRWLRSNAELDGTITKLRLVEQDACGLGDGVAVHSWSDRERRVVTRRYDPGFYFPVHDVTGDDTPPDRVHIAWQYEAAGESGKTREYVRRLTWELLPASVLLATDPTAVTVDPATGQYVRRYPWTPADQAGSPFVCVFSDGTWPIDQLGPRRVDDFDPAKAMWRAVRVDQRIDFLPLGHHQGEDIGEDFGRSVLATVAQLLDELAAVDTDVATAGSFAAGPTVAISNAFIDSGDAQYGDTEQSRAASRNAGDGTVLRVRPGVVFELGENGRMDVLDLSGGLAELCKVVDGHLERLSVNAQVPGEMLGRVDPGKVLAGVAIALRLGPFRQFIDALRLVHTARWSEWLTMTQKLAMAAGEERGGLAGGEVFVARVVPGQFLPQDLAALVEMVAAGRAAGIVSEEQAVALLVAGGMTYDDAAGEVARIRQADPERAKALFEATGNDEAAAAWAGVEPGPPAADPGAGL